MSYEFKKFLEDAVKTHIEKAYEEKQMDVNGVYSPIEFILSETEQEKVNVKFQEINDLFNSSAKADEYEPKAKAWDIMKKDFEGIADTPIGQQMLFNMSVIMERIESGESE